MEVLAKIKFYAYYLIEKGIQGIVNSWDECKSITSGHKGSRYKSFPTYEEANKWLISGAHYEPNPHLKEKREKKALTNKIALENLKEGIYFDSGTGRGIGVEARVTDKNGNPYLPKYFPKLINEFHNIPLGKEVTNNYGELIALYCALKIAFQENIFNIYGDSNLVIYYWSQGRANFSNLNEKTVKYIHVVSELSKEFKKIGGTINFISGDINPADLGFHKS